MSCNVTSCHCPNQHRYEAELLLPTVEREELLLPESHIVHQAGERILRRLEGALDNLYGPSAFNSHPGRRKLSLVPSTVLSDGSSFHLSHSLSSGSSKSVSVAHSIS